MYNELGPGLLESAYEVALAYELQKEDLVIQTQVSLPLIYEDVKLSVVIDLIFL